MHWVIRLSHFAVIHLFMTPAEQYFKTSPPVRHFFHSETINCSGIATPESCQMGVNDCAGEDEAASSGFA